MRTAPTSLRCSACGKGKLLHRVIEHDVGPLLDMRKVVVSNLPALVCSRCGAVSMYGGVLEQISLLLAASILSLPELLPVEVRYLRKLIGDTQDELARRLGVARATVNRWERGDEPSRGPDAYAIRSHAFFRLRGANRAIEAAAPAFIDPRPSPRKKAHGYKIEGAALLSAN